MLASFDAAAVAELLRHAGPDADAPYLVELRLMGGALARPGAVRSALARRDGAFVLYAGAAAEPEEVSAVDSAYDRLFAAMAPWSTGGACVNFLSRPDVTAAQLATGYQPAEVDRLAAVKRDVDPHDVFRTHHGRAFAGTA